MPGELKERVILTSALMDSSSCTPVGISNDFVLAQEGKVKNTPWGSSYRAPPKILHGEQLSHQK